MEVNKIQKGESTTLKSNVTTHRVETTGAGCDSVDHVLHCTCCETIMISKVSKETDSDVTAKHDKDDLPINCSPATMMNEGVYKSKSSDLTTDSNKNRPPPSYSEVTAMNLCAYTASNHGKVAKMNQVKYKTDSTDVTADDAITKPSLCCKEATMLNQSGCVVESKAMPDDSVGVNLPSSHSEVAMMNQDYMNQDRYKFGNADMVVNNVKTRLPVCSSEAIKLSYGMDKAKERIMHADNVVESNLPSICIEAATTIQVKHKTDSTNVTADNVNTKLPYKLR